MMTKSLSMLGLIGLALASSMLSICAVDASRLSLIDSYLKFPERDDVNRVCNMTLSSAQLDQMIAAHPQGLLILVSGPRTTRSKSINEFAELAAQLLEQRSMKVCRLVVDPIVAASRSAAQTPNEFEDGDLILYQNGQTYKYYGERDVDVLLPWILKHGQSHLIKINGKLDKIAFDNQFGVKAVGFFMLGTPELVAYEEVAKLYSSVMPFYLVTDRVVAKHLKLRNVGEVKLVKKTEKLSPICPQNPATAQDLIAFIEANKGLRLTEITKENLYDPNLIDHSKVTFLAIGDRKSPAGAYFFKLLHRMVKNSTKDEEKKQGTGPVSVEPPLLPEIELPLDRLNILWLDPRHFPTLYIARERVAADFGLNLNQPQAAEGPIHFGMINLNNTRASFWFPISTLNMTSSVDRCADDMNLRAIKEWILALLPAQLVEEVKAQAAGLATAINDPTLFNKMPQSQVVEEGADATLSCLASVPIVDCQWFRNNQPITSSPRYVWLSPDPSTTGDCSLLIRSVSYEKDNGTWRCQVQLKSDIAQSRTVAAQDAVLAVNLAKSINEL